MSTTARSLTLVSLLACAAVPACKGNNKTCDATLEAVIGLAQSEADRALIDAPEDMKAQVEARYAAKITAIEKHYVEVCTEADEATLACVERIDELIAAGAAYSSQIEQCQELPQSQANACADDAFGALRKTTANCEDAIGELMKQAETAT